MNNLKKYRLESKLSQYKLAEMLKKDDGSPVGRTVISQLESGKRRLNLKTAQKLSAILHVDPYELMGEDNLKRPVDSESISKVVGSIIQSQRISFVEAFCSLANSYLGDHYTGTYSDNKDKFLMWACQDISNSIDGFSEKDMEGLYGVIRKFMLDNQIQHKQAMFDFQDELGLNSGDKNEGGNK